MNNRCRICGNTKGNKYHQVEERMFNMGESFEYLECSRCGTLQLNTREIDFGKYYPNDYGAFEVSKESAGMLEQGIRNIIARALIYLNYPVSDKINCLLKGKYEYIRCLFGLKINSKSRMLDVGCGSGSWLSQMSDLGYSNLTGVDLYNNSKIKKFDFIEGDIFSISDNKRFDVITLHHAFEHMDFPGKVLDKCSSLLADDGVLIIRIPVMGKYAWKQYGTAWAQIDAPRHLFLYTEKALNHLLKKSNLKLANIYYDSNVFFQIKASEIYKNTRLSMKMSIRRGDKDREDIQQKRLVKRLNQTRNGDQAIFIIRKK